MLRASVIHPHVILCSGGLSVLNHDKRSFIAVYQSAFQKLLMHPVIQKGKIPFAHTDHPRRQNLTGKHCSVSCEFLRAAV